jgi:gamma-butyrobetaine dioxygenase
MIRIKVLEKLLSRGVAFADLKSAKNSAFVLLPRVQSASKFSYSTRSIGESGLTTTHGPSCTRPTRIDRRDYQVHAAPKSAAVRLVPVTRLDPHTRALRVQWSVDEERLYPYAWLRDSCRCSACFHESTRSRLVHFHEINLNDMPTDVEVNSETQELVVTWSDDHRSAFSFDWLLEHNLGTAAAADQNPTKPKATSPLLWNSDFQNQFLSVDFHRLLKDDHLLYNWLTALEETGLVLISNAPQVEGQLEKIANRIAFARLTCFGPAMFVRNKDYRGNVAYTTSKLELHNAMSYYDYIPGVKMVHCIQEQSSGVRGRSLFADGFMAADEFRQQFPDQFQLLTSVKVDFCAIGKEYLDYHLISRHSTIKLDERENIVQIVYNSKARDSSLNLAPDQVDQFYHALQNFAEILHSPKNLVEINLRAGTIVCLNNWRVLHGRTPFDVIPSSEAVVQRGYMDWDEVHSKRRVIGSELGIPDEKY